ncbi:MAG: PhnE/PtxC family ABC transporter permease, partial [Gemmatimonadota bacterium]
MSRGRSAGGGARRWWAAAAALVLAWAVLEAGLLSGDLVNAGGWPQVREFLGAAADPALDADFLARTGRAAFVTLAFAVCGTFLSLILGTVGGVLGSEVWWATVASDRDDGELGRLRAAWLTVRGALAVPRSIHEILWGLFFINIVGLDPIVGVLAIAIPYGAITAKLFSEILDETSRDALRALRNAGVPSGRAFLYGLLPEAFRDLLSYAFYRFECSIRSAAVLGIIGAGGLGYELFLSMQSLRYPQMWTLLAALIALTGATDLWSGFVRRRLGGGTRVELEEGAVPEPASDAPGPAAGTGSNPAGPEAAAEGGDPARRRDRPDRDPVITGSLVAAGALLAASAVWIGPHVGEVLSADAAR